MLSFGVRFPIRYPFHDIGVSFILKFKLKKILFNIEYDVGYLVVLLLMVSTFQQSNDHCYNDAVDRELRRVRNLRMQIVMKKTVFSLN